MQRGERATGRYPWPQQPDLNLFYFLGSHFGGRENSVFHNGVHNCPNSLNFVDVPWHLILLAAVGSLHSIGAPHFLVVNCAACVG